MEKLGTDYIDLMLLHQPFNDYYGAYRALEDLYEEGKLRAIGVSNFYPDRLVDIASFTKIPPMVNQVETHIFNQQKTAKEYMDKYKVQIEAWAPFGEGRGGTFDNPVIAEIAALDKETSSFFSHYDPAMVEWFVKMVEERKKQHDSSKGA
jgi:2,5-diketo-D-gluconate reductase A